MELRGRAQESFLSHAHRRNVRKGLRSIVVERCSNPTAYLDDWNRLYDVLAVRHAISGIARFSRGSFARQLAVPGLVALRAESDGSTVGMMLWFIQGEVATYHLAAYDENGYRLRASFALLSCSIEYFREIGLRWLNLQGGAGIEPDNDGLARFKSGWSTTTRTAYFCGRILHTKHYAALTRARNIKGSVYFPAYRHGEFT